MSQVEELEKKLSSAREKMREVIEQVQKYSERYESLLEEADSLDVQQRNQDSSEINSKCAELERKIKKVASDETSIKKRMQVHDKDQLKAINNLKKQIADKMKQINYKDE